MVWPFTLSRWSNTFLSSLPVNPNCDVALHIKKVIQLLQIENCLILHLVMIACLTRFRNLQKKTVKSKVWLLPTFSRWKCILITSQKTKCTIWNNSYQLILVGRDCSKDGFWKYIRPILFTFNVGDWSIRPIRAHD